MKNKIQYFLLIGILVIGFFLRFYKLGQIPNGFYQDESAIGYNAYSILQTGKDEHGMAYPLYFKSFGDYKLPVYVYLTIPAIKIFGMTEFAVRFPSALFGFLTVLAMYFFVKELTANKQLALVATGLLAINPWSLDYNRATFEVSISLFLFVLGGFLLHKSIHKKVPLFFLLGTVCFIIDIYTYNLTRLLSPLLYIIFIFPLFKKRLIAKKELVITLIISVILLIPFVKTFFDQGGISSAGGTLIFSSAAVKAPLLELRSYVVSYPLLSKILFNMPMQLVWQYILNVMSYLSIPFLFISGSLHGNHGIGNVGQFYLFELPLMILGIIGAIKNTYQWKNTMIIWAIITVLIASLTRDVPQATRSFFLIVPLEIFSALGLLQVIMYIKEIKKPLIKVGVMVGGLGLVIYAIAYYFVSYYVRFPIAYAKDWREQDKAVSLFIKENQNAYNKIIFDNKAGFIYTSLLFYQVYSPATFQKTVVWSSDDSEGMSRPVSFGTYEFKDIDWSKDRVTPKTLIITSPDAVPSTVSVKQIFYYPERPVVISTKQEIHSYPVNDPAYVVIEK